MGRGGRIIISVGSANPIFITLRSDLAVWQTIKYVPLLIFPDERSFKSK